MLACVSKEKQADLLGAEGSCLFFSPGDPCGTYYRRRRFTQNLAGGSVPTRNQESDSGWILDWTDEIECVEENCGCACTRNVECDSRPLGPNPGPNPCDFYNQLQPPECWGGTPSMFFCDPADPPCAEGPPAPPTAENPTTFCCSHTGPEQTPTTESDSSLLQRRFYGALSEGSEYESRAYIIALEDPVDLQNDDFEDWPGEVTEGNLCSTVKQTNATCDEFAPCATSGVVRTATATLRVSVPGADCAYTVQWTFQAVDLCDSSVDEITESEVVGPGQTTYDIEVEIPVIYGKTVTLVGCEITGEDCP